jgi:KaiC/GvpD/RAD55 family RecA-like ATPase
VIYRLIAPKWAMDSGKITRKVLEGEFTHKQLETYNAQGYNIYYLPNYPSYTPTGKTVDGSDIDVFEWVFVDCDLKEKVYDSKEHFLYALQASDTHPTKIVDSGNGIHAYWRVLNLDPMSYLRFQRRLMRLLHTDEAVGQLYQLMRYPGTVNTKVESSPKQCKLLLECDSIFTAEELDKMLPTITVEDEQYCKQHYDKTYGIADSKYDISDVLTPKFGQLMRDNPEAKELWTGATDDRSKNDYRLGHLMFANGFTREEAASVLVNSAKALNRAPIHRQSYATNIIDKIWTFELAEDKDTLDLSSSVTEILLKKGSDLKGTPFRCHPRIDNTEHGFRLGQVVGLVAGSGVGKTAFALNMFQWFAQTNPDYHHFFIPLEQPANEIADRWKTMCGEDMTLHDKIHVISNYDDSGNFRHLSFDEIKDYIEKFKRVKGVSVGCVVIDHIGALKKKGKDGENQDLMDICHSMKAFAVQTNTLLVMQSQTSREKAGIGDLELNKDAAYGTVYFESYCDYLIALWQPLKRCHSEPACPTVTAFKFCKIRHKKARKDIVQEDVPYFMYFDSETERMRDMTQSETVSFNYFLPKATNKRKLDRKVDVTAYISVPYKEADATSPNKNT